MNHALAHDPAPDMPAFIAVEARHGRFLINRHDIYVGYGLLYYGEYCEVEWRFFQRFIPHGATVIDAGANVGALAVPMARHVGSEGRVMAFEPQPLIFRCLKDNAAHNNLPQLLPLPFGLGAEDGIIEAALPDYEQQSSFASFSLLQGGTGLRARIVRLDDVFTAPSLSFIKMDIEGMELQALKGATRTISQHRPVIYIENDKDDKSAALISWFLESGYRLWWHTTPMFNPDNVRGIAENVYGVIHNINMIALPVERLDLLPLIPASMRPVSGPHDTLRTPDGVIPSFAG